MNNHLGNDIGTYGDGYMEQEEEWEREGLLDPAWEKQQKKVSNIRLVIRSLHWSNAIIISLDPSRKTFQPTHSKITSKLRNAGVVIGPKTVHLSTYY